MRYFSVPADFKRETIRRYHELNQAYKKSRMCFKGRFKMKVLGKKHGKLTRWYKNGQVSGESYFVDDRPHGARVIAGLPGQQVQINAYRHGLFRF